jgi:SRSO17 transposase
MESREGEQVPTKHWLSTLPHDMTLVRLVELAKLCWRIRRDYQKLK